MRTTTAPTHPLASRAQRGFTLVELMVVVAIIGILVVTAVLSISPERYARSTVGFTEQVAATLETMRVRAVAKRAWQRLEVSADGVVQLEAAIPGMTSPDDMDPPGDWYVLQTMYAPDGVSIHAVSDRTHVAVADSVPDAGDGFDITIDFAPDGAGTASTIFIGDRAGERKLRIAIWGATGAATVFEDW